MRARQGSLLAALFAAFGLAPAAAPSSSPVVPWMPPTNPTGGTRGRYGARQRPGSRPRLRPWFLVNEMPPGIVRWRRARGLHVERLASGIWVWPEEYGSIYREIQR